MQKLSTQHFESSGETLISFGSESASCGKGSFTFWKAIMSIDDAEEFATRLMTTVAEAKASRDASKANTETQPESEA